jgi:hypothetical protein
MNEFRTLLMLTCLNHIWVACFTLHYALMIKRSANSKLKHNIHIHRYSMTPSLRDVMHRLLGYAIRAMHSIIAKLTAVAVMQQSKCSLGIA